MRQACTAAEDLHGHAARQAALGLVFGDIEDGTRGDTKLNHPVPPGSLHPDATEEMPAAIVTLRRRDLNC